MAYQSFEDLKVWKRSTRLSVELTNCLVECKDYAFKNQLLRSSISIPSNIAEGAERQSYKEFRYFLNVAKGSAAELRTQFYIAMETQLVDKEVCQKMIDELKELSSMLQGLIKSIYKKLNT
ncbi:four helix bundle protein [Aliifodinibius salicampi]|uniref:Four helix bundle protein n=1 Tax=Fodinibius salicampi TaxID=1920655 RepID=A0ABT3PVC8_9BACT|nr:four helix bundle protein [Fodinibius salicampi]MCW9711766.1 four helix bundle protein [Fodinibius salicampi]